MDMFTATSRLSLWFCGILICVTAGSASGQITEARPNPDSVSIKIGAAFPGAPKVPDTLFGSFLEPIGDSINHGLSAEILVNPSLEGGLWNHTNLEAMFRRQPKLNDSSNQGLPLPWEPLNAASGNRFQLHTGDAANSWQSLEIMGIAQPPAGIKQQVYLPTQRTRGYRVSLYVRHLQGSPQLTVLFRSRTTRQLLAQATIQANNPNWTKYTAKLDLPPGAVAPLQPVDFGVRVEPDERVDLDEISLMPDDAIDGLDPDAVAMAKSMNLTELRFGGNFSSTYNWRDGIGPYDKRVTMENIAWGIPEYNTFGTDEFLRFCKLIGAIPQFDLNMGSGTPQEAADWVRYIRQHYSGKVIYELGNELYGPWQTGWVPVDQIAARTLAFSQAVRAVAPHAEIIATGETPNNFQGWNAAQLSNPPGTFNYLSTHFIHTTNQVTLPGASQDFMAAAAYALPFELGNRFQRMHAQVDTISAQRNKVQFALTEWLFASRGSGQRVFTQDSPSFNNLGGALMTAGIFNTLLRNGRIVPIADMTGVMEFAGIWKRHEQVYATPSYYTFRLYASVKGDTILPVQSDTGAYNVQGGVPGYENISGVPYIDVTATLSPDQKTLTLFCLNRELTKDVPVRIDLGKFRPLSRADVVQMTAANRYQRNDETDPRRVVPGFSTLSVPVSGPVAYTLPHEGLTIIRFHQPAKSIR
jgi:alpha-N-arabinofuranosidase